MAVGVKFECVNADEWNRQVMEYAHTTGKDIRASFIKQAQLLCKEMIDRTPPFSGKTVEKMLLSQGKTMTHRSQEIADEQMTARQVGERRVEKDIRRIIFGVRGAKVAVKQRPQAVIGQTTDRQAGYDPHGVEFGVLQKCEGRDAVRIFATKKGEVYGIDLQNFKPNATMEEMARVHEQHRTKRGRVTQAGSKDRIVGRWRWLEVLITSKRATDAFIKGKKKAVGQAKGGWAAGLTTLGGRVPNWIGRHLKAGACTVSDTDNGIEIVITNRSRWASSGDDDRIIEKSLARRTENMRLHCETLITGKWGGK